MDDPLVRTRIAYRRADDIRDSAETKRKSLPFYALAKMLR